MIIIIILIIAIIIEFEFSPRLGFTRSGKILLFYGKRERKYIKIW